MDYSNLEVEISHEIDWRIKELSILKVLSIKRTINSKERELIRKFAIPNIYSTWEGYVKSVLKIYINKINSLTLKHTEIHGNILTHSIDTKYPQITTGVKNEFKSKCDFVNKFIADLYNPIAIETKFPTESNINLKVLNQLLLRLNLEQFPDKPYEKMLNDLLFIRNSVAHGDNSIPITQELIDTHIENVIKLMDEIMFKILNGCIMCTYKNKRTDVQQTVLPNKEDLKKLIENKK